MAECHHAHEHHHHAAAGDHGKIATDPVCGMTVDTTTAEHKFELGEGTYYFCSARCLEKFKANPDAYLNPTDDRPVVSAPAGTIWTCPMHPEIRRDGPGSCPICGMALEPLEPSLEEGPNPELIDMTRRFWVSTAFTVPLAALVIAAELFGLEIMPMRTLVWVQLALATPVVLWGMAVLRTLLGVTEVAKPQHVHADRARGRRRLRLQRRCGY